MNIEVEQVQQEDRTYVKGAKRQRVPFKVNWDCPGCGERKTVDYSDKRYLSYPKWNTENTEYLYCQDCGTKTRVEIIPELNLDIQVKQK